MKNEWNWCIFDDLNSLIWKWCIAHYRLYLVKISSFVTLCIYSDKSAFIIHEKHQLHEMHYSIRIHIMRIKYMTWSEPDRKYQLSLRIGEEIEIKIIQWLWKNTFFYYVKIFLHPENNFEDISIFWYQNFITKDTTWIVQKNFLFIFFDGKFLLFQNLFGTCTIITVSFDREHWYLEMGQL